MLSCILSHLSSKDAVNMKTMIKEGSHFHDTLDLFLHDKFEAYLIEKENEKHDHFMDTVRGLLNEFSQIESTNLRSRIAQIVIIYDYLLENRWFIDNPDFDAFQKVVERKLIDWLVEYPFEFGHLALHYLAQLFDIHVKMSVEPYTQETFEYIIDRQGNTITW